MRITKIFVVSDDQSLLPSIEELLIEPEPSFNRIILGSLSNETIEPSMAISKILEHSKSNICHMCIVIDGRRLGVSSVVSENINESGNHLLIFLYIISGSNSDIACKSTSYSSIPQLTHSPRRSTTSTFRPVSYHKH
jgi:hypothetical protein